MLTWRPLTVLVPPAIVTQPQDQQVLESQQPKRLPLTGGECMVASDRLSAAYRKYLKQMNITFAVC